jgi:hypothetical protein
VGIEFTIRLWAEAGLPTPEQLANSNSHEFEVWADRLASSRPDMVQAWADAVADQAWRAGHDLTPVIRLMGTANAIRADSLDLDVPEVYDNDLPWGVPAAAVLVQNPADYALAWATQFLAEPWHRDELPEAIAELEKANRIIARELGPEAGEEVPEYGLLSREPTSGELASSPFPEILNWALEFVARRGNRDKLPWMIEELTEANRILSRGPGPEEPEPRDGFEEPEGPDGGAGPLQRGPGVPQGRLEVPDGPEHQLGV